RDDVQLEAIAAELNIFLADKVVTHRRIGYVVEMRKSIAAEAAFSAGPSAVGARNVPGEVLTSLLAAVRDDNPRVALEALYAFGTLAPQAAGAARRDLSSAAAPQMAGLLGAPDPSLRFAAARVIGRVFEKRAQDGPIDQSLGDAVIRALNDKDR